MQETNLILKALHRRPLLQTQFDDVDDDDKDDDDVIIVVIFCCKFRHYLESGQSAEVSAVFDVHISGTAARGTVGIFGGPHRRGGRHPGLSLLARVRGEWVEVEPSVELCYKSTGPFV